jgi:hypothetical protein
MNVERARISAPAVPFDHTLMCALSVIGDMEMKIGQSPGEFSCAGLACLHTGTGAVAQMKCFSHFKRTIKMKIYRSMIGLAIAGLMPFVANSQMLPGPHPGYLHSLTDLRAARWFLYHQPGDSAVAGEEDVAITEIDAAINEIKRASIDDHKDLNDHPHVDIKEHGSRLLKAIETLHKAHGDIDQEEDNPDVRELRHRALEHIDKAIHAADEAHTKWVQEIHK